jgi:hypothetical protein
LLDRINSVSWKKTELCLLFWFMLYFIMKKG